MKSHANALSLLFLILTGFLVSGCRRDSNQVDVETKKPSAAFELMILSHWHDTTLYINAEPAGWASASARWNSNGDPINDQREIISRGFPIHIGSNSYSVEVTPDYLPDYKPSKFGNPKIFLLGYSQESKDGVISSEHWRLEDTFNDELPETNDVAWDAYFEIKTTIPDPGFELLGGKTNAYMAQVRSLTVKLAHLIKTQDAEGLASALSLPNKKILLTNCPEFFAKDFSTNIVNSACVTKESEINVEIGKRLVLAYPEAENHLVHVTYSIGKQNLTSFIDYFTFARKNGKWMVSLPGSEFFSINAKDDSATNETSK